MGETIWSRRIRATAMLLAAATLAVACAGGDDDSSDDGSDDGDERAAATEPRSAGTTEATTGATTGATATPATPASPATSVAPTSAGGRTRITLPPDTTPDPVRGGTLRFGMGSEVDGLNPTSSALTAAPGLEMAAAVFEKLAELTPEGDAVPWLAESFTPDADHTTWTVVLRQGITFHDGTPLDAEAVRINFEAQLADPLVGIAVRPFYPETGAIEVVDEFTVRFHLLEPNVHWPAAVATQVGMVASPTWIAAALADPTLNQQPVGTGPFRFESRVEDSLTRFVRYEDYWGEPAYLDAIEYRPVPGASNLADLLLNGDLDAIHTIEPATIGELRQRDDVRTMVTDTGTESFFMLNTAHPPFDDVRARQALALATPKQNYLDLIGQGNLRGSDQMFTPESPFYNPDVRQRADEPDAVPALVADYCAERGAETNPTTGGPTCTDGMINIEYQYPAGEVVYVRIADLLESDWGQFFNIDRQELVTDTHILETITGSYNVVIWAQFGGLNPTTDHVWLLCRNIEVLALNFPRYCDEARDAELLAAQATTDPEQRIAHYREAVRLINEAYTYVFMTHTLSAIAMSPSVHGPCDRTAPDGTPLVCFDGGAIWPHTIWIEP
jgi:peptide/nickel transport system substrate-binding protein